MISQPLRHTRVVIVVMVKLKHFLWVKASRFQDRRHVKVVRFSALRIDRLMSMKNSSDPTRSGTRDLPACGAVPRQTAPPPGHSHCIDTSFPYVNTLGIRCLDRRHCCFHTKSSSAACLHVENLFVYISKGFDEYIASAKLKYSKLTL